MSNLKSLLKKSFSLLLSFAMFIPMAVTTHSYDNESYDLTYDGIKEKGPNSTAIQKLIDKDGKEILAFCIDLETSTSKGHKYARMDINDASYYPIANSDRIRSIIKNSYPFITISEMSKRSNISNLSQNEAINATQFAIWHYSNSKIKLDFSECTDKTKALYNWLITLPKAEIQQTEIADILIDHDITLDKDTNSYTLEILFKADGINADGSKINLNYVVSQKPQGAIETEGGIDSNGYKHVIIKNLPINARPMIDISGTQTVKFDGYFYMPENGRLFSQSLVGAYEGKTNISLSKEFACSTNGMIIRKIDSMTSEALPKAVFEVSSDPEFRRDIYKIRTNEKGEAKLLGLKAGTWHIRELIAPRGYIKYTDTIKLSVGKGITKYDFKNTPMGKIKIIKLDQYKKPVEGAIFSLYKGKEVNPKNLVYHGLQSKADGTILVDSIPEGNYTIVETSVPSDYRADSTPQNISVENGSTSVVTINNHKIVRAKMLILKRDIISEEQLGGAIIGIYSDPECKNCLKQITTQSSKAVEVDGLMPGSYYVKELEPPEGYLGNNEIKTVELAEAQTATVTFLNDRDVPTAGNYGMLLVIGIGLSGMCFATVLIRHKYSKKKDNA